MKVFSKKKYEEIAAYRMNPAAKALRDMIRNTFGKDWTDVCDGKEVINGKCAGFSVEDEWCIDMPRYKIEITCEGKVTTAKLIVNDKTVKKATTWKHPDDKFNIKIAASVALGRLFAKKRKDERGGKRERVSSVRK